MRPHQLTFEIDNPDAEPVPVIYLASRLTGVDGDHRKLLDGWCTLIEQAVTDATVDSGNPWRVAVHTPLVWSAPWNDDGRTPRRIYQMNSQKVADSAALILLVTNGGGLGVGQELAWATALRLPILLLHPHDEAPSRQALGTPADIKVVSFDDAMQLVEAVKDFVRSNRHTMTDAHRRRESLTTALIPVRERLAEAWAAIGDTDRDRVEAESRVHRARIQQLVDANHALAGASISELFSLAGALSLDLSCLALPMPLPDLNPRQRDALALAADEYEWGGSEVLALETRARLELARGGVRRLPLVSPADWLRFRRDLSG